MLVVTYLVAIVAANLSVAHFGAVSAPINGFLFVGLDLAVRDRLHDRWKRQVGRYMPLLILAGSVLSYAINVHAARVAIASGVAFAASEAVKTAGYVILRRWPQWKRVNTANVPAALTDSVVFPTMAFGFASFLPLVIGLQFIAKVVGAAIWSWILYKFKSRNQHKQGESVRADNL